VITTRIFYLTWAWIGIATSHWDRRTELRTVG